jgi:membrane protein YqaA with SNARE-associated domain
MKRNNDLEINRSEKWVEKHKTILSLVSLIIAILVSILAFQFRDELTEFRNYGYTGIFFLSIIGNATILLPLPIFLTAFIGGGLFQPLVVGIVSAAGGAIGELTGYIAGFGGQELISKKKFYKKIKGWMDRYGLISIFLMAAVPNPFFDIVGIVAGVMRVPLVYFLILTFLGQTIKYLAISYLGAGSANLFESFIN